METENEMVEVSPISYITTITTMPDIQVDDESRTGRSNWQLVSSQGRLCRKLHWRWYNRFGPSSSRPDSLHPWQKPG